MKQVYKLAIFDLDGTLLDTLGDLANSMNYALEQFGLPPHPKEAYRYFVGNGARMLQKRALAAYKREDLLDAIAPVYIAHYRAHSRDTTKPYNGVTDMLSTLRQRGIKLAVLSNKPHGDTAALVPAYFGDIFDFVLGQKPDAPVKPDPQLVKTVLEACGEAAENTIYLGDSGVDMQTAKNGGLFAVGAAWGFRDSEELWENGADAVIDHPLAFLELLK